MADSIALKPVMGRRDGDPESFFTRVLETFDRNIRFLFPLPALIIALALFALGALAGQFILGFALAMMLNREFRGESVVRMLLLFPIIATPVAMSMVWAMMLNPMMGILNYLLAVVGLPPSDWASRPTAVMPTLIMVDIWHWTPFMMLVLLAGLKNLPKDPYEAAMIDGASRIQVFFKITLPLMQ